MKKIKEMAFFFSSVAVVEKKVQENECEEGKDGHEETVNNNSQKRDKDLLACNIVLDSSAIQRWP